MSTAIFVSALSAKHWPRILLGLGLTLLAVVLVRTAWLSDDAYITFRTIDNFIHGYGLRWNTFERVQGYTHPLWMFLLSAIYFCTREIHVTSLVVSIVLTVAAAGLLLRGTTRSVEGAVLAFGALLFSNAFIEYGTSGLENPLTYLLAALFVTRYFATEQTPDRLFGLALLACLAMLNRMDTILLFAPALAWRWWRARSLMGIVYVALAFLPMLAWEMFSLVYYGFLTPNTAFAKLNTGVSSWSMLEQGVWYYITTFYRDPFTIGVMIVGVLTPVIARQREGSILALGVALYMLYIVRIGGDFMLGRFFAAPVFVLAGLMAHTRWRPEIAVGVVGGLLFLLMGVHYPAVLQGEDFGYDRWHAGTDPPHKLFLDKRYVKDQRGLSYPYTSLLRMRHTGWEPSHKWEASGRSDRAKSDVRIAEGKDELTRINGAIGYRGYYSGPHVRIIDSFALTEPLLARLPTNTPAKWLIGHFDREAPTGYMQSVATGKNQIKDPGVAAYYEKLKLITQGGLWSRERWNAIYAMNLGQYETLLKPYREVVMSGKSPNEKPKPSGKKRAVRKKAS